MEFAFYGQWVCYSEVFRSIVFIIFCFWYGTKYSILVIGIIVTLLGQGIRLNVFSDNLRKHELKLLIRPKHINEQDFHVPFILELSVFFSPWHFHRNREMPSISIGILRTHVTLVARTPFASVVLHVL